MKFKCFINRLYQRRLPLNVSIFLLLVFANVSVASEQLSAPRPNDRVGTGFGINNTRDFAIDAATQYLIEGDVIAGEPTPSQAGLAALCLRVLRRTLHSLAA